jgi:hypothetical protein
MAFSTKFLNPSLLLLVHSDVGAPTAFRVNVRKLAVVSALISFLLLASVFGSLLFFRELEINRKLATKVLELEMREQFAAVSPGASETSVARGLDAQTNGSAAAAAVALAANPGMSKSEIKPETTAEAPAPAPAATGPRIGEFNVECDAGTCGVRVSLVPTASGLTQGQMLIILEAEIPRIGTRNPTTNVRKRFFVYPGNLSKDEMSATDLATFEAKSFRFTRALQTNADFAIGNLLRPLAVNVYLYDTNKTLISHERRVIETAEEEP